MTELRPIVLAAGPLTLEEAEAVLSSRPPPFARELKADVAGATPAGGSTGAGVEAGDGERGVGPVTQVRREDRPTYLPMADREPQSQAAPTADYTSDLRAEPDVERCSCEEALALRAELGRVLRERDELQADLLVCKAKGGALEARRDEACAEADSLREQLADLRRAHDTDAVTCREALDRVDELTAEVERLRAEPRDRDSWLGRVAFWKHTAEQLAEEAESHLSSQPATAPTAIERGKMLERMFDAPPPSEECPSCNRELLAPARTEADAATLLTMAREAWSRTEAEQAVLEAMAKARVASLRQLAALPEGVAYASVGVACRAELARRGLKP